MSKSPSHADIVDDLAEEFVDRYRNGERPPVSEFAARCPERADEIRELFPALVVMEQAARPVTDDSQTTDHNQQTLEIRQLGDFRIIQEVGRGGMGIVYEAEQVSLGRRVALKVLPKQALLDSKHKQRFIREAKAAARLHHTNIVPVFGVGHQDGLHYYVMQFIHGLGLDEVLLELQRLRESSVEGVERRVLSVECRARDVSAAAVANSLISGHFERTLLVDSDESDQLPAHSTPDTQHSIPPTHSTLNSQHSTGGHPDTVVGQLSDTFPSHSLQTSKHQSSQIYWQSVARIGQQSAQALQYAHDQGIIHRDVKPGNLLLDTAGSVWVTDFGLAKAADQQDLTHTGDVLGTLRYMAPEQFEGKADARSDVFSLGLTLYELLALKPAFDETVRHKLVKQVTTGAPPRLRTLDSHIPRDLETIVHKAIDRDPSHRYQAADEMAADLQRYLGDEPIHARRPTFVDHAVKWARRHQMIVAASVAMLAFLALGSALIAALIASERDAAIQQRDLARENLYFADIRLAQQDWEAGNVGRMLKLLDAHRPDAGEPDLRGWEWYYLSSLTTRNVRTFHGHSGPALAVAWSPDGLRLASGGTDGTVKIWDVATGNQLLTLRGHEAPVRSVCWSPDGRLLASGGGSLVRWDADGKRREGGPDNHSVIVWDTQQGQPIRTLPFEAGAFAMGIPVAWSPDGRYLACGAHHRVQVIETENWASVFTSEWRTHRVTSLAWRHDSQRMAWVEMYGDAYVWNPETLQEELSMSVGGNGTQSLFWNPDGERIAVASRNSTISIWTPEDLTVEPLTIDGHGGSISAVEWSPVNDRIASASHNGMLKVWNPDSGEELLTLRGHSGWVHDVCWSPAAQHLASAGDDGTIRVWDAERQDCLSIPGRERVAWHPDGRRLAVGTAEHLVKVVDAQTGGDFFSFPEKFARFITALAWTSDGSRLAAAGGDGVVRVWDARTRTQLFEITANESFMPEIRALSWSPDDRFLATGGMDQALIVWDAATGAEAFRLEGHEGTVGTVVWSADGRRIASASWDQVVKIWDVSTRQEQFHLLRDDFVKSETVGSAADCQYSVVWSADGRRLFTGSAHGDISVWDTTTGHELMRLPHGHSSTVRCLSLRTCGQRLASSGNDGVVRIWDVETGRELLALQNDGSGRGIAWSPDGRRLVAAGKSVSLWDGSPGYDMENE